MLVKRNNLILSNRDKSLKKYTVIDLFCGIGGFSYGFEMTGKFKTILGVDNWDTALNTFKLNHKDTQIENGDICKLDNHFWKKYKGKVDVIIAGPPCQGFSMSGRRNVLDPRNSLFKEVVRIVQQINPKVVVIENVVGLLSMTTPDGVSVPLEIEQEFKNIGYFIKHKILNATEYGVPQNRKRVIFIAAKKDNINFPVPEYGESKKPFVTVGDAIGNIPEKGTEYLPCTNEYQKLMAGRKDILNHNPINHDNLIVKRMSYIPQGGNWRDIPIELGQGGGVHSNNYRRLCWDAPSITIKHVSKSMIVHPIFNRTPTVREVARLQTFNDNFEITGTRYNQHQQLANAVPPLMGKAIANSVIDILESSKKKLKMIDLFSGIGGIRLAFEYNGVECVASSEIDKKAIETYKLNFNDIPLGDISKVDPYSLPYYDILSAGFPCQPFSTAGKRLGFDDTRGTLFFEVARLLSINKPKAFFLENVEGIVNHDKGHTIEVIEKTLTDLNYDFQWKIMNACHYGIPQNRARWYCIGFRKDLNLSDRIHEVFPDKRGLLYTTKEVISNSENDSSYRISKIATNNIKINLEKKKIKNSEYPLLANEIRPSRCNFRNDGISPCLTAKMGTGGNNVPVIVEQNRKLSERECLRLMSFPSDFKIKENSSSTYKQIGNSVVVEIISLLAKGMVDIINSLED